MPREAPFISGCHRRLPAAPPAEDRAAPGSDSQPVPLAEPCQCSRPEADSVGSCSPLFSGTGQRPGAAWDSFTQAAPRTPCCSSGRGLSPSCDLHSFVLVDATVVVVELVDENRRRVTGECRGDAARPNHGGRQDDCWGNRQRSHHRLHIGSVESLNQKLNRLPSMIT